MAALTVLRLPPRLQPVGRERGDDVLDAVALGLFRLLAVRLRGVAHEALLLLLWGSRGGDGRQRGLTLAKNSKHSSLSMDAGGCFLTRALHNTKEDMLPEAGRAFELHPVSNKKRSSLLSKNISSVPVKHRVSIKDEGGGVPEN